MTADIVALRQALTESWAEAPDDVGTRYRAYRLGQVIDRYYKKAKNGQALRKGVLTKAAGRTLTAYFGGGWLDFLAYIGEDPHPSEQIIQALPETRLMVGTSERAAQVAEEQGLSPEEVQRMLAAYWQQSDSTSPVEQRVEVIKRFWDAFDDLHARQQTGMPSLWGLVDHGFIDSKPDEYKYGRHRELLPPNLVVDIERLWGSTMLPRWPDRIVSEPAPHAKLARALGPALTFWHGAALTAWFLCQGPYSRTEMDGLANYHDRELDALAELGCPVSDELFRELQEVEQSLEPIEREYDEVSNVDVAEGVSISIGFSKGPQKLRGFEQLRDIITRHRRTWTHQHFDRYLRARWERDLRSAGDAYNRLMAQRTQVPTAKQFAKAAAPAANLWFGGNISGVYSVLGLKSPVEPTETHLIPNDPVSFARRVFDELGGRARDESIATSPEERAAQWEHNNRYGNYYDLAQQALNYVQLEEALGRPPEPKEFGTSKFKYRAEVLSDDVDEAFRLYGEAVHRALNSSSEGGDAPLRPQQLARSVVHQAPSTEGAVPGVAGSPSSSPPPSAPPAGWYEDPWGEAAWRWWDGQRWTEHLG